jgi:hypothetical protein
MPVVKTTGIFYVAAAWRDKIALWPFGKWVVVSVDNY